MHARRLIAAPLVAIAAFTLVGAIIDSGERARLARSGVSAHAQPTDPARQAESRRIRDAQAVASRCSAGAARCSSEVLAAHLRHTARSVTQWRYERRFHAVRLTLHDQLLLEAQLLDQRAAADLDGVTDFRERARIDEVSEQRDHAELEAARAQRAAGLLDRAAYDAVVEELT